VADEHIAREPHSRLTRLAAVARDAVLADPEWNDETDMLFVSIDDKAEEQSAFYVHGYEGPRKVVKFLLMHMRALGKTITGMD
jgi:hypothetical protein